MAKEWKNRRYTLMDVPKRDCPCMIYNGQFYIGGRGSSHATLIQECICGMSFTKNYDELYYNLWNDEGDTEGIIYTREEGMALIIEDEDTEQSFCFGEVILDGEFKGIYWDIDYGNPDIFIKIIQEACNNDTGRAFNHYWAKKSDKIPLKIEF